MLGTKIMLGIFSLRIFSRGIKFQCAGISQRAKKIGNGEGSPTIFINYDRHETAATAQATAAQIQTAIQQSEASSQPTGASVGQRLAASMTEEEIRG